MSSAAPTLRSFEELYAEIQALPEGMTGEVLDPGRVHVTMGRPGRPHRFSAKRILAGLGAFDVDSGGDGWWIETEPEVRFGARVLAADLAGWRVEREKFSRGTRCRTIRARASEGEGAGRAGSRGGCPSALDQWYRSGHETSAPPDRA